MTSLFVGVPARDVRGVAVATRLVHDQTHLSFVLPRSNPGTSSEFVKETSVDHRTVVHSIDGEFK